MKKIGMLFFMAFLMSAGRVVAAVPEHHVDLKAKPAEVPRSILAEAGVGTEEASLKIFNGAKNGFHQENGQIRYYEDGKVHTGF